IPVIADAYFKGITDFDIEKAFSAMKYSADREHLGLDAYKKNGFIGINDEAESVSKTLEYAYDDWCISQIAKNLGKTDDYNRFIKRAQSYKNIFNPKTGFMQPKRENIWKTPFDPSEVDFNFTEANSWQYSFFVPQDVQTLIKMHGGDDSFTNKLDALFAANPETSGRLQSDITGLIGQYAHGNEPSHHMAYLYNYAGEPWKTQKIVRQILDGQYTVEPDGLSGNEDCGQMSAWYVLSAMGFYSVTPGSTDYIIGTPLFKKTTLNLENGNIFIIEAENVSEKNIYIQSAKLNGKEYTKSYIAHNEILEGGTLSFEMGAEPNKEWANKPDDRPKSEIGEELIQPVPFIKANSKTFKDSLIIQLGSPQENAKIFYTLDGSTPDNNSSEYKQQLVLTKTTTIKAVSYTDNMPESSIIETQFIKIPRGRSIQILSNYSKQYTAGGDEALIDYIRGGDDFRNGSWQGYQKEDFVAIVNLGKKMNINKISTGFLQAIGSWIWMPTKVEYHISNDGKTFKPVGSINNKVADNEYSAVFTDFSIKLNGKTAQYIKVTAKNYGTIPGWHLGAGGDSWIFVDEITIE
ncbi:MAG: hypothetical protein B6I20_08815, partial [Bacteroidetes bacterium 4572_117]